MCLWKFHFLTKFIAVIKLCFRFFTRNKLIVYHNLPMHIHEQSYFFHSLRKEFHIKRYHCSIAGTILLVYRFVLWPSVTSLTDVDELDDGYQMVKQILQWPGKWNGGTVGLRLIEIKSSQRVSRDMKLLLMWMKDSVSHPNILRFFGLTLIQTDRYIVSDYSSKGPLKCILNDDKYNLNKDFKLSLSLDIASGLTYLHSKGCVHGNLRASCCLVDFKWVVKIADWEYVKLYSKFQGKAKKNPLLMIRKDEDEIGKDAVAFLDFWTAPEILKSDFSQAASFSSDIYSYAIVLQEIFTRKDPYFEHADTTVPSELIKNIMNNNLRPQHDHETPGNIRHVMECSWYEESEKRPTSEHVRSFFLLSLHNFKNLHNDRH